MKQERFLKLFSSKFVLRYLAGRGQANFFKEKGEMMLFYF